MQYFDPLSLSLFIAICEHGSLTEAAERQHLSVSAVSKRLAALEELIGAPLLERGRGNVQLTAAGEALLPAARGLLQSMLRIQADLSEYALAVPGHVRVACTLSAMTAFLPPDVAAFRQRQPQVDVRIDERAAEDVVRSVEEGRADIGVCWEGTSTRRLQTIPYRVDHLVMLVHPKHELAPRTRVGFVDTLPYPRVLVQGGSLIQQLQQRLAIEAGKALKAPIQVRTYDVACRIVAENLACAIVPEEASYPLIKAFGLKAIPLTDSWARRRYVVCMQDYEQLTLPARLLVDSLGMHRNKGWTARERAARRKAIGASRH
jgi:molybdate transport repressor ModE-like protein